FASALLDMRSAYEEATDERRIFGLPPDFVPFPPDATPQGAVRHELALATAALERAIASEEKALQDGQNFRVAEIQFVQELARMEDTHDASLQDICGSFEFDGEGLMAATIEN